MCGIVGIWKRGSRTIDLENIERMLSTIVHRGPDGAGTWQDDRVAFGHRRLSILDTSERASQPMLTGDGQGVLVYNGETYNYETLRRELEAEGHLFKSTGDTEVVLMALHHWGPETAIPRLNGMFALAYFDRRDDTLWLARDRLGIKTLVTAETGDGLLFASEVKALLAYPAMRRQVDRVALTKWMVSPKRHPHRTLFEGVSSLDAGSWWKISAAGIDKHHYFHVVDELDVERILKAGSDDFGALVDEFEQRLRTSVTLHLASDVPLATMCSGGVDSSLITAYCKDDSPDLVAYVADIDFAESEAGQAERVGAHLGVPVRRVPVNRQDYLRLCADCVWHSDGPLTHLSDAALLAVTRTCQADGIKVLLTGEGSDELFGGYREHLTIWRKLRILEGFAPLLPTIRRKLRRYRRGLNLFESHPQGLQDRRLMLAIDSEEDFVRQQIIERLAPVEPLSDRAFLACGLADLCGYLTTLLHRHDRLGMAASIEMRVPFVESRMIDYAMHLPRHGKLHRQQGKRVVKSAAVRRLPTDVVYAKKKGFPTPRHFLRGTGRLLAGGRLADEMGWSRQATDNVIELIESDADLSYAMVGLELWLRLFFDGESSDELGERLVALAA